MKRRMIPFGKLAEVAANDPGLTSRQRARVVARVDDSEATSDRITELARRFGDVASAAGCVRRKRRRTRPERLWVSLYLMRRVQKYPAWLIALAHDLPTSYVYSASKKGRRLFERAGESGRFDDLMQSARSE